MNDVTNTLTWNFVDTTTMVELVERGEASTIQNAMSDFLDKLMNAIQIPIEQG